MDIKVCVIEKVHGGWEETYNPLLDMIERRHFPPVFAVVETGSGREIASFTGYHARLECARYIHSKPGWRERVVNEMVIPWGVTKSGMAHFDWERQFADDHELVQARVNRPDPNEEEED